MKRADETERIRHARGSRHAMMTLPQGDASTRLQQQGTARLSQSICSRLPMKIVFLTGGALVVYTAILIFAMHAPSELISSWVTVRLMMPSDVLVHFLAYAGLTLHMLAFASAVRWACLSGKLDIGIPHASTIFVIVSMYALIDEVTQPATGRSCQFTDWLADIAGALLAVLLVVVVLRIRRGRFGRHTWQFTQSI